MKKKVRVHLTQLDWVDYTPTEKEKLNMEKPHDPKKEHEVILEKSEYEILVELGQMDLLD